LDLVQPLVFEENNEVEQEQGQIKYQEGKHPLNPSFICQPRKLTSLYNCVYYTLFSELMILVLDNLLSCVPWAVMVVFLFSIDLMTTETNK
jgi:hypothetical protein